MKDIIAAFDFDGTITTRDSLLPFLFFTHGKVKTTCKLLKLTPFFLLFLMGLYTRQGVKEKILTSFYKGIPIEDFENAAKSFALGPLNFLVREEALERIRWHQSLGHRLVIVSASTDTYLNPWAQKNGFERVISSRPAIIQDKITGTLLGENCWGEEKPLRLLHSIGKKRNEFILFAYGDSQGDQALLKMADFPFYKHLS